jgi:hypothetical protein
MRTVSSALLSAEALENALRAFSVQRQVAMLEIGVEGFN